MNTTKSTLSWRELALRIGVVPSDYDDCPEPFCGTIIREMKALLCSETPLDISVDIYDPRPVHGEGSYCPGEIWIDIDCVAAYLYAGKMPGGEDVVINLGGDTVGVGNVETGIINEGIGDSIFFDELLFSPHNR